MAVNEKLKTFVSDFVGITETSLTEFLVRLTEQVNKSGKTADCANTVIDTTKGFTEAITDPITKAAVVVTLTSLQLAISGLGNKLNRDKLKKLPIYKFLKDPAELRNKLIYSGIVIFQNFEAQFVQVTANNTWERAMAKLAQDAVSRVFDYHRSNPEEVSGESILKGVLYGTSKSSPLPNFGVGHTVQVDNIDWNTSKFFCRPGIVTLKENGSPDKYFCRNKQKKDKGSNTKKYGYRRQFEWEDLINFTKEENICGKYIYTLKKSEIEDTAKEILEEINKQDPNKMEEKIQDMFKNELNDMIDQFDEDIKELETFLTDNFEDLKNLLEKNQTETKELLESAQQQREEIARENKDDHRKTQVGVEGIERSVRAIAKVVNAGTKYQEKQRIWFDVRATIASFTGRDDQLQNINRDIKLGMIVITGLGGVGKSELAIEYANRYYAKTEVNVVWINAKTLDTAKDSYRRLLKELNIKTMDVDGIEKELSLMAKEVYAFIAGKVCLLIIDNAVDYSIVESFIPQNKGEFQILITSINKFLFNEQEHGQIQRLDLDVLPQEAAKVFVKSVLEIQDTVQDEDIIKLVQFLGCLPLALHHAVAYIIESGYAKSISDCVEVYKKSKLEMESFLNREGLHTYKKTILLTFSVAIKKVKETNGNLAENILCILVYFASDNIPKEIFQDLARDEVKDKDVTIEDILASGCLARAITLLEKFSLIKLMVEQISIHPLMQEAITIAFKRGLEEKEEEEEEEKIKSKEKVILKALGLLGEYTSSPEKFINCLPHVMTVWEHAKEYDNHRILIQQECIAAKLDAYGRYREALDAYKQLLNSKQGQSSEKILLFKNKIASLLQKQEKYSEALEKYEELERDQKQNLGAEHTDIFTTQHNIAKLFVEEKKYGEASAAYKILIEAWEPILGPESSNILQAKENIAWFLEKQGKYDEALTAYESLLEIRTTALGEFHRDTLLTLYNKTHVLQRQGKDSEVHEAFEKVLKNLQNNNDEDSLIIQQCHAFILKTQKKYPEALQAYQKIQGELIKLLGPDHPHTLNTYHNIACIHQEQQEYSDADVAFKHIIEKNKEIFGPDNPATLRAHNNHAVLLQQMGKYDDALKVFEQVLEKFKQILIPDHPETLTTQHNMASVHQKRGDYDKAIEICKEVLVKRLQSLGPDHPDVINTKFNLASAYKSQGNYQKALEVYKEVGDARERLFGPKHDLTLAVKTEIGLLQGRLGNDEEAKEALKHVRERLMNIIRKKEMEPTE